jgi:CheY-like chemotaxis protein
MMPAMNGQKFLAHLAQYHADDWAKIPIVIATAKGSLKGAAPDIPVERIRKPMDLDELYRVVEKYGGKVKV